MFVNHPRLENCLNGLGLIALALCLMLSLPGVEIARAETGTKPASQPAAPAAARQPVTATEVFVAAEREGELDRAPRAADPRREARGEVITLNTRGYNYGPDRPTARPVHAPRPAAPASPRQDD